MIKTIIFFISLILFFNTYALETDQFIAGNIDLKDSTSVMNSYFLENMDKAIDWANSKNGLSCHDVALKVMKNATGYFTLSQASTFASKTPLIDRFPNDKVSERGYINQSFYEHSWLPLQVVYLARTISINNIHVGTDKLGHFSHMGMRYYKNYLRLIKNGMESEDAIRKSIISGFSSEYGFLGYGIDGVLSYGDLEGNYQGFMFALDMCRGENPIIIQKENIWMKNPEHLFDLKNYFTPQMDESYNLSFWRTPLFRMIKEKLIKEYCAIKDDPKFIERMNYYESIKKYSLNDELIAKYILSQERFMRAKEDIKNSCN